MAFKKEEFRQVKYYAFGSSGTGASASDAASPVDSDIMPIEAGMVIEGVDVIITSAVTGTITIGDDDAASGFATSTEITEGTPGAYAGNGSYLTSNGRKYYSASGKEVKLDATTISAGAFAVAVRGYKI